MRCARAHAGEFSPPSVDARPPIAVACWQLGSSAVLHSVCLWPSTFSALSLAAPSQSASHPLFEHTSSVSPRRLDLSTSLNRLLLPLALVVSFGATVFVLALASCLWCQASETGRSWSLITLTVLRTSQRSARTSRYCPGDGLRRRSLVNSLFIFVCDPFLVFFPRLWRCVVAIFTAAHVVGVVGSHIAV